MNLAFSYAHLNKKEGEAVKAKQAKGKGGAQVVACTVEVCAPAVELKEIIKRRALVHNHACAHTDTTSEPTCTSGEAIYPVGLAAYEAMLAC